MKLEVWMERRGVSCAILAELLELRSVSTIYRYLDGRRTPKPAVMRRILLVTGGDVTANDFMLS